MRKIELNKIRQEIEAAFPLSDLSPEESRIGSECHLRFELGAGFETGTTERVDKAVDRATTIFEIFFEPQDEVWVVAKDWEYKRDATELWKATQAYFESQFRNFDTIDKLSTEVTVEEFDEALNSDGVMELTDFTTTHLQIVLCDQLKKINYRNILRGIANLEMGLTPSISTKVHFVNMRNKVAFYMYDDRGCVVFASDCNTLRATYGRFNHWLVDYHRPTFDALFGSDQPLIGGARG